MYFMKSQVTLLRIKANDFELNRSRDTVQVQIDEVLESVSYHAHQNNIDIYVNVGKCLKTVSFCLDWGLYKQQLYQALQAEMEGGQQSGRHLCISVIMDKKE